MKRALILSLVLHFFLATLLIDRALLIGAPAPRLFKSVMSVKLWPARQNEIVSHLQNRLDETVAKTPDALRRVVQPTDYADVVSARDAVREVAGTTAGVPGKDSMNAQKMLIAGGEISADSIRQYRLNLARETHIDKRFLVDHGPYGWQGEVGLVVGSMAGSVLPQVSLHQSSGVDDVDAAALDIMRRAVRNAVLPEELRGKAFALTLPIRFGSDN